MGKSIEDIERDVEELHRDIDRLELMRDIIIHERTMLEINHQRHLLMVMGNLAMRHFGPPPPFYL